MASIFKKVNDKFLKVADFVSWGMGTPTNIFFWVLAVVVWFWLGYTRKELFINGNFLPEWFTSTAWNFPLNTITTLAELYIGFLVAAAANRSERELRKIIRELCDTVEKIEIINKQQNHILDILIRYQEKEISMQKTEIAKEDEVLREVKEMNGHGKK